MLGNCEKMALISSTANEWPQNQLDETGLMASSGKVMEKPAGQDQQQQQPLKCPRCDSSNTKFCYYNNYSLSQPRHFCKACKRYWTRGGTLRNVPVGGGYRKNKRVKRPTATTSSSTTTTDASAPPPQIDHHLASTHNITSPLFYGLPSNPSDLNLSFPSFNSRVSTGFDLQPQFNSTTQIQESFLSNHSLFGSSSTASPTMASLMPSTLQQRRMMLGGLKETRTSDHFQGLLPFEDLQMAGNHEDEMKDVRMEEGNNKWNMGNCQNQIEPIGSSVDQSLYNWNAAAFGAWPDLNNFGSSVTPLI